MFISLFCDSVLAGAGISPAAKPYDESYLMWDKVYCADTLSNGSNVQAENITLFKQYDVRSHRKLQNQNDTLILSMTAQGNLTIASTDSYDIVSSVLLKLPGR
ncbi:hypothetical protein WUBG_18433, partial [Wuchereria bancrofti]